MALELINSDNIAAVDITGDEFGGTVTAMEIGGTTYLAAASDIGIGILEVGLDGTMTPVDTVIDTDALELNRVAAFGAAEVDGTLYLFAAAGSDHAVTVFAVGPDGELTIVETVTDTADLQLFSAQSVATATFGNTTYLFVGGRNDDGFSSFRVEANGSLTSVENINKNGGYFLDGLWALETAVVNGSVYLYAAGFADDGVSVFQVAPDGTVAHVENLADGGLLELDGASAIAFAEVGNNPYLFVTGRNDDGVSVFSVGLDGRLTEVVSVDDDDELLLDSPVDVTTTVIDGITYLFVAGNFDDGVSIFSVAEDGSLTNVANIEDDDDDLKLDSTWTLTTAIIGGDTHLFASGSNEGVSGFKLRHNIIDEADAAVQVAENDTAVTTVAQLYVEDDVTFEIVGGADWALFDVDANTGAVTFLAAPDFEAPTDADGDNIYEVEVEADDGIITETKTLLVEVTNEAGLTVEGTSADETHIGSGEEDTLLGKKGEDTLKGKDGNDLLDGGKHKDILKGGDGADIFRFGDKLKDEFADRIKDFEVGIDTIHLDSAIFTEIGDAGDLKGKYFELGKTADSSKDRILYQEDKGWLRYDADGKGGDDAVKFARVDKDLDLSEADFMVI